MQPRALDKLFAFAISARLRAGLAKVRHLDM
jgi:hypothetical protein